MKRAIVIGVVCLLFSLFGIPAATGENRTQFVLAFGVVLAWALGRAVVDAIGEAADPEEPPPALLDPDAPPPRRPVPLRRRIHARLPGRFRGPVIEDPPTTEIESLERSVAASLRGWSDAQQVLVPILRRLAADRLRVEHGVYLRQEPEKARAVLGEAAWPLYAPAHRSDHKAEIDIREIDDALRALEDMG